MANIGSQLSFDQTIKVSMEEPSFLEEYRKAFPTAQELNIPKGEEGKKIQHAIDETVSVERSVNYRETLPIFGVKKSLLETIQNNQVLIVSGGAGSGKSTQLSQYAMEAGVKGRILSTHPRRRDAISAAKGVSEEMGTELGQEVGYSIRFENRTSSNTIINYMTDGMLLREFFADPDLSCYSMIIIDKAHERSIHTDVLFGLLKTLIKKRPELKLIISSDSVKFGPKVSKYFFDAPIVTVAATGETEETPISVPKIQTSDLAVTLLQMMIMDVNFLELEFMDAPPSEAVTAALNKLYSLSALDEDGHLTALGKMMAKFPLEPSLSKSLITSVDLGCSEEMLAIAAMLQVSVQLGNTNFYSPEGDYLTLLNVYNSWKNSNFSPSWFEENSVLEEPIQQVKEIRNQLLKIFEENKMAVISCGGDYKFVQKAICSGFFMNAAKRDSGDVYHSLLNDEKVTIHPYVAASPNPPDWVVYQTLDTQKYLRRITVVEPKWLVEYGPSMYCI